MVLYDSAKLSSLNTALGSEANKLEALLDADSIANVKGRTVTFKVTVTNFMGRSSSDTVSVVFESAEGILIKETMDRYYINPDKEFKIKPLLGVASCTKSEEIRNRINQLQAICYI